MSFRARKALLSPCRLRPLKVFLTISPELTGRAQVKPKRLLSPIPALSHHMFLFTSEMISIRHRSWAGECLSSLLRCLSDARHLLLCLYPPLLQSLIPFMALFLLILPSPNKSRRVIAPTPDHALIFLCTHDVKRRNGAGVSCCGCCRDNRHLTAALALWMSAPCYVGH